MNDLEESIARAMLDECRRINVTMGAVDIDKTTPPWDLQLPKTRELLLSYAAIAIKRVDEERNPMLFADTGSLSSAVDYGEITRGIVGR